MTSNTSPSVRNEDGFRSFTLPTTFDAAIGSLSNGNGNSSNPGSDNSAILDAIKRNGAEVRACIESETTKAYNKLKEEVKIMIEQSENRAVERACANGSSSGQIISRSDSHHRKRQEPDSSEIVRGVDIICEDDKLVHVISEWYCRRSFSDINLFWTTPTVSNHNSSLSVILFGIQRKEGLGPYQSSLGIDMGKQAREIVSMLLWNARCSVKLGYEYNGSLPSWLFSLVPVCRKILLGAREFNGPPNILPQSPPLGRASENDNPANGNDLQHSNSTCRSEAENPSGYDDFLEPNRAWKLEAKLFREGVMKGCLATEVRKSREKSRRTSKTNNLEALAQDSNDKKLVEAQDGIAAGAQAVRKCYSNILSQNRCNAREKFFDTLGFLLYQINKLGVREAKAQGYMVQMEYLKESERTILLNTDKFHSSIGTTRLSPDSNGTDNKIVNLQLLERLTDLFPSFIIRCKYPLSVDRSPGESENNQEEDPVVVEKDENINMISLSVIILTELTRAGTPQSFLSSSKRALHAVIVNALSFRGLICRTLGINMSGLESFVLGNVFLVPSDIPPSIASNSTVICFVQEESNETRLKSRLRITRKQYALERRILDVREPIVARESDEYSDLFEIPR